MVASTLAFEGAMYSANSIRIRERSRSLLSIVAVALLAIAVGARCGAFAAELTTIYSFCAGSRCTDDTFAVGPAPLTMDSAGNLFGASAFVKSDKLGAVFELVPNADKSAWAYGQLFEFCTHPLCQATEGPVGNLILDTAGNVFGVTTALTGLPRGTIYELMPNADRSNWKYRLLYTFCPENDTCLQGGTPSGGLTYSGAASGLPYDGRSPLYGVTLFGGAKGQGVVYELSFHRRTVRQRVLYNFCPVADCPDGRQPSFALTMDSAGNLYGATAEGGPNQHGTIFELSAGLNGSWTESVLHGFCALADCADGRNPSSGVTLDASGNILGTTYAGGNATNTGVAYRIFRNGNNIEYTVLKTFCELRRCHDGETPVGGLVVDSSGNIFGTTAVGGTHGKDSNAGTIFELNDSYRVIYDFCALERCADGEVPQFGLIGDGAGNFLGTTLRGGDRGVGTVFQLTP